MRPDEALRRAAVVSDGGGSRPAVGLARLAIGLLRVATALVLLLPVLALAIWLAR